MLDDASNLELDLELKSQIRSSPYTNLLDIVVNQCWGLLIIQLSILCSLQTKLSKLTKINHDRHFKQCRRGAA